MVAALCSPQPSLTIRDSRLFDRDNGGLGTRPYSQPMLAKFRTFLRDESGATAIEYVLTPAGISVAKPHPRRSRDPVRTV